MKIEKDELFSQIALTKIPHIGYKTARKLLSHFGSAKAVLEAKSNKFKNIEGVGQKKLETMVKEISEIDTQRISDEIQFIEKHQITPLFLTDKNYPQRLKECEDAPMILYYKGSASLNAERMIAVIGTRNHSDYGLRITEALIEGLQKYNPTIISGMAYGIDIIAHRKALKCGLETIGVFAHGLDIIYPEQHKNTAKQMTEQGGLLTEYTSNTNPEKQNFPMRNRIVAGMSDAIVVVETREKGGAMITAKLGIGYHREVAAFPGRTIDQKSLGCNYLIQTNIAHLIQNADDFANIMNWQENEPPKKAIQAKLFSSLSEEEKQIVDILKDVEFKHIDEIVIVSGKSNTNIASILLSLELQGFVRTLPGKKYSLI